MSEHGPLESCPWTQAESPPWSLNAKCLLVLFISLAASVEYLAQRSPPVFVDLYLSAEGVICCLLCARLVPQSHLWQNRTRGGLWPAPHTHTLPHAGRHIHLGQGHGFAWRAGAWASSWRIDGGASLSSAEDTRTGTGPSAFVCISLHQMPGIRPQP